MPIIARSEIQPVVADEKIGPGRMFEPEM